MDEADVDIGDDHPDEDLQVQQCVSILRAFTRTPDELIIVLWDGYGIDRDSVASRAPRIRLPAVGEPIRDYMVMTGTERDLTAVDHPAFIWPADHAWCLASDVDPHWAGIGASSRAITTLLSSDDLDVVRSGPGEPQPRYY